MTRWYSQIKTEFLAEKPYQNEEVGVNRPELVAQWQWGPHRRQDYCCFLERRQQRLVLGIVILLWWFMLIELLSAELWYGFQSWVSSVEPKHERMIQTETLYTSLTTTPLVRFWIAIPRVSACSGRCALRTFILRISICVGKREIKWTEFELTDQAWKEYKVIFKGQNYRHVF